MENIYELLLDEDDILEESIRGKVGVISRKLKDLFTLQKKWSKYDLMKTYENKDIPEDKFKELLIAIKGCYAENDNFSIYKKHYNKICSLTGIPSEHSVICKCNYGKKDGKFWASIKYNVSPKKITIPAGHKLYHYTTAKFEEMKPTFKTKPPFPYLFSSPRCYFTIHKEMPMYMADIRTKEKRRKTTMVTPKENISVAWIDPLILNYAMGAVFVETRNPIKVTPTTNMHIKREQQLKLTDKKAKKLFNSFKKESVDELNESEEPVFDNMLEFMEYYGLEFCDDDDEFEESFASKLGEITRSIDSKWGIRKAWKKLTSEIKVKTKEVRFKNRKEKEKLKKDFKTISDNKTFLFYKKSYNDICKFFGITEKNIIIERLDIAEKSATIRYSESRPKKIIIPNDSMLLHASPVKGIKELEPTFRSKVRGRYLYPSKRVYFTIGKQVSTRKGGMNGVSKLYRYTPRESIKTAYIDPACTDFGMGAIYIDTMFPIPVKQLEDKPPKGILGLLKKESVDDILNNINESYDKGLISEDEKILLECKLLDHIIEEE